MSGNLSRVSVIVPVRDGARHLGEALESVLAQTHPNSEIWVVDDGSRDESAAVAARFSDRGVRCVSQPPSGAAAARNRGVALATGDFLAFLDADDLWTPDKLACQCAALEADSTLDLVFGHAEQFISLELDETTRARLCCPEGSAPGFVAGAMLARRAVFTSAGPFETRWELGEFLAWFARVRELGRRERMLDRVVLRRRLHETNQGRQKRGHYPDYARILKAALDRRRRQAATES